MSLRMMKLPSVGPVCWDCMNGRSLTPAAAVGDNPIKGEAVAAVAGGAEADGPDFLGRGD